MGSFGGFITCDAFPDVTGEREAWVSEKLTPEEGVFFAANALACLVRVASEQPDAAYAAGPDAERALWEGVTGPAYRDGLPHARVPDGIFVGDYLTLPDPKGSDYPAEYLDAAADKLLAAGAAPANALNQSASQ